MSVAIRSAPRALASLWLTLAALATAAFIAASTEIAAAPVGLYIAVPFGVLCLNLVAALAIKPALRRQVGLLGFHIALALLALLVGIDRLTSFSGNVEVTEGASFDASLVRAEVGPLHPWRLDKVRFEQRGFQIRYAPGMNRRETESAVRVPTEDGGWRELIVGDDKALVVDGYRFYTSFNKGFAPILTYVDERGVAHMGAVHLPSYPLNYYRQGNEWTPPGWTQPVKLWLHIEEPVFEEGASWRFDKPKDATLVVMRDDDRRELRPGESMTLGPGRLRYDELRSWMGYTISYNAVVPWMLGAIVIAVFCLAWHMVVKFRRTSWLDVPQREARGDR